MDLDETIVALLQGLSLKLQQKDANIQQLIQNTKDKIMLTCLTCLNPDIPTMTEYLPPLDMVDPFIIRST